MARPDRPAGFRGGLARWVSVEEARELAGQVASLETAGQLVEWCDQPPFAPRSPVDGRLLGFVSVRFLTHGGQAGAFHDQPETPLTAADRDEAARVAIVELAAARRYEAAWAHVRERGLSAYVALGGDGTGRSLLRCPACDASLHEPMQFGNLYCATRRACLDAQAAEVAEFCSSERATA